MKSAVMLCALLAGISAVVFFRAIVSQAPAARCEACSEVTQAIEAAGKIKAGSTREDVEKEFTTEGGLSTREERVYVFKECHLIKVVVTFSHDPSDNSLSEEAPGDVVKSVSKPFLQYPIAD
ncbi:MAG TPA: hypothetical protein VF742_00210 [Terracidiphilus sp.]|jgi:hypothetical protein